MRPETGPEAFNLDRSGIKSAFDRASTRYEVSAVLQAQVSRELLDRLAQFKLQPQVVLDLGAGTGRDSETLKRHHRRALVIALDLAPAMLQQARRHQRLFRRFERICADAVRLPLAAASVDVVFSNLMLQWCQPLDAALVEIRRVLKPEGIFAFSTFGPDTLKELRAAWSEVDGYSHVNYFADMHDVGEALMRAGLVEPVLDVDHAVLTYANALSLMRDLKLIGAHNVTVGRARGLTGRHKLHRLERSYETFRGSDGLPATYEIIYGVAWGAGGRPAVPMIGGEVRLAPGAIRRRERR